MATLVEMAGWLRRFSAGGVVVAALAVGAGAQVTALVGGTELPDEPGTASSGALVRGSVTGTVIDASGAIVPDADVVLTVRGRQGGPARWTAHTDSAGDFVFADVLPGSYELTVNSPGFHEWKAAGLLGDGERLDLPEIALGLPSANSDVAVSVSRAEIAAAQVELQEKQRIMGVFPNFYTSYQWDAVPLTPRQKFQLAWKFSTDPVMGMMAGAVAAGEQSGNAFSGYGGGVQGYGKRLGAAYADGFSSTMLGQAILPVLFRQDPRYFVKGTGSVGSRAIYAIETTVMCRGDNGKWQVNYSNILGNMLSASLSNVYYPAGDRHGLGLTVQNSMVTTAMGALGGLMQEFVLRKLTPGVPDYGSLAQQ